MENFSNSTIHPDINIKDSIRVLVIDDDDLSAHIAKRFLKDLGCVVECLSEGEKALVHFKMNPTYYDLILMDISLPDIDGYSLAKAMTAFMEAQKILEKRPVLVALTVYGTEENRQSCLESGMKTVLVKPLLRMTAEEILKAYIPKWGNLSVAHTTSQEKAISWNITGEPIDFDTALKIHNGDIEFIKSAFPVVIENLATESAQLQTECINQHWDASRVIIHRLQGGTRYFGLKRLDKICERFLEILKSTPASQWKEVYSALELEIGKVHHAYAEWVAHLLTSKE